MASARSKRNSDGTRRRADRPQQFTRRSQRGRWVEAETLRLKILGMSFEAIAEHITGVARGGRRAVVELPANLEFPADYHISFQAVQKAFRRSLARTPAADLEAYRKLDTARCEELYLALQGGLQKGDPRSVEAGVKVLAHKAEINGYKAPARVEMTGRQGGPLAIETFRQLCEQVQGEEVGGEETKDDGKTK